MPEFSSAFQCPLGSRMNPKEKCKVWYKKLAAVKILKIYILDCKAVAAKFNTVITNETLTTGDFIRQSTYRIILQQLILGFAVAFGAYISNDIFRNGYVIIL